MYCGYERQCVCVSVRGRMPTLLHGTDPDVTWGTGKDAPWLCTAGRICSRYTGCVAMATKREREMSARYTLVLALCLVKLIPPPLKMKSWVRHCCIYMRRAVKKTRNVVILTCVRRVE